GIQEASVSYLQPNRNRGTRNNTLPGNSNWFEWQWPIDKDLEGCILAQSIPNIGDWTIFTQTQLEKLQKHEIKKPTPHTSTPTTPILD
ncbi:4925_t:CDS:2, partial [Scutellospora calospora]